MWFFGVCGDLLEFNFNVYNVIIIKLGYCKVNVDICKYFMVVINKVFLLMKFKLDEVFGLVKKVFGMMLEVLFKCLFDFFVKFVFVNVLVMEEVMKNMVEYVKVLGIFFVDVKLLLLVDFYDNSFNV